MFGRFTPTTQQANLRNGSPKILDMLDMFIFRGELLVSGSVLFSKKMVKLGPTP